MFNNANYQNACNIVRLINKDAKIIAVSKTKPFEAIKEAYDNGVRFFGENYIQEFVDKYSKLPLDIKWHYIGQIQSNKIKNLMSISNLHSIDSIHSIKHLNIINNYIYSEYISKNIDKIIYYKIEINSSNEDSKAGFTNFMEIKEVIENNSNFWTEKLKLEYNDIAKLNDNIPFRFNGLMTLNKIGDIEAFKKMTDFKNEIESLYKLKCNLSMGTTQDFQIALENGADEVRIGTSLFGSRN